MHNSKSSWQVLKGALIMFAIVWLGMGLLAYFAAYRYDTAFTELKKVETALQQLNTKNHQLKQAQLWLAQYEPIYRHWHTVGLVGEERRLDWVKHLQQIQQRYHLPHMQYQISEQIPYVPEFITANHFTMRKSVMRLEMLESNQSPMLQLLRALQVEYPASMQLRHCQFLQQQPTQLQAICEIDWLTIQEP